MKQNFLCFFMALILITLSWSISAQTNLTARQVIDEIQKHSGGPWKGETVDVFKTGNPDTPVTGIVTTMFATMDVLKQAVANKCNLIITHEPTFYNHLDDTASLVNTHDKVYAEKRKYIEDHHLVIWRFHDHIHALHPDGIITGVVNRLGWEKYQAPGMLPVFNLPETTVKGLASEVQKSLGTSMLRVIGDPDMKVTKVAFLPGAPGSEMQIAALQRDDIQVLLIGESREWETIEYARDEAEQGRKKAVIILGHVPSEESGMEECASWLKTFITHVQIIYVKTPEPYWVLK
jgi:putative NIF3 family GTP cyclohydrolase 1 type 2